jgi:hypothetical protein
VAVLCSDLLQKDNERPRDVSKKLTGLCEARKPLRSFAKRRVIQVNSRLEVARVYESWMAGMHSQGKFVTQRQDPAGENLRPVYMDGYW